MDVFHVLLFVLTVGVLGDAVVAGRRGISMANCLLVVTLAPMVTVVGYELVGHRHAAEAIAKRFSHIALVVRQSIAVRGRAPGFAPGQKSGPLPARRRGLGG